MGEDNYEEENTSNQGIRSPPPEPINFPPTINSGHADQPTATTAAESNNSLRKSFRSKISNE